MLQDLLLLNGNSKINPLINYNHPTILMGGRAGVYTSEDLINWVLRNYVLTSGDQFMDIAYGNNRHIAISRNGHVHYSLDNGHTWNSCFDSGNGDLFQTIVYGGGKFIIFSSHTGGRLYTSPTGLPGSWTVGNIFSSTVYLMDSIFANDKYIAVGSGKIITTLNGINYSIYDTGFAGDLPGIAYGNGIYVVVSNADLIFTSLDAISWSSRSMNIFITNNFNPAKITFGNGLFVAVGSGGKIATSVDSITWTFRNGGVTETLLRVKFINDVFIASTGFGKIITSADGIDWTVPIIIDSTIAIKAIG